MIRDSGCLCVVSPDSKEVGDAAHRLLAVDIAALAIAGRVDCKEAVSVVEEEDDVGMQDTVSVSVAADKPCIFRSSRYRGTYLSDPVWQHRKTLYWRLLISIHMLGRSRSVSPWRCSRAARPHHVLLVSGLLLLPL